MMLKPKTDNLMKILSEIKDQLIDHKPLSLSHQEYLINVALKLESGIPADTVLEHTKILPVHRGKKSNQYQKARYLRDLQLEKACSLLDGSFYGRCTELARVIKEVKLKLKSGGFEPINDIEKIILQLIKSGLTVPGSPRQLYTVVYSEKLNL